MNLHANALKPKISPPVQDATNYFESFCAYVSPWTAMQIEARVFDLASSQVEADVGGQWGAILLRDLFIPVLPDRLGHRIVLIGINGSQYECDRVTASAAITVMAINQEIWRAYRCHHAQTQEQCTRLQDDLRSRICAAGDLLDSAVVFRFLN